MTRLRIIVWAAIACACPLPAGVARSADESRLRVGTAAASIAADDSMQIAGGIGPQYYHGQEGQLRAVATVIEHPTSGKFAIVACDVVIVSKAIRDHVIGPIEKECGISPDRLLLHATHNHHAPSTIHVHGCDIQEQFVKNLEEAVVQAVVEANGKLTPDCQFAFHLGEEAGIGQNSRLLLSDGMINWIGSTVPIVGPTGPFDPQLPVWIFRTEAKPVSVLFDHSTHTIGQLRGGVRSPAFYGLAAQALEEKLGAQVTFLQGASGSTHNMGTPVAEAIQKIERDITEAVHQAKVRPVERIVSIKQPFRYRVRTFDEGVEDQKVVDYCKKHAAASADAFIDVFRKSRLELKPLQGQERETVIGVLLIGDVALVTLPAEFFTGLGMDIKKRSPYPNTYIAELTDDYCGYLPDREAHRLGGYQTWMGLHSFSEEGTGERMVDEAVALLEKVAGKKADEKK